MGKHLSWIIIVMSIGLFSCGVVHDTPKHIFSDGYYSSKVFGHHSKVYVNNSDDSLCIYPLTPGNKTLVADPGKAICIAFPHQTFNPGKNSHIFRQSSFDIDFLTIPFKFRPRTPSLPTQFNTNLNGAVYVGYRNDTYHVWYKKTPLNYYRQATHYGFSFGLISGIGGTAINQWVTENRVASEYDGVVWSKGIAAILGVNGFSLGMVLGWDNLLDSNRRYWIYQHKPWVGLAFGLSLN